jgi:hypothetical protein
VKRAWLLVAVVVAVGFGAGSWWYLRRDDDCRRFARTLCAESPENCRDLEIAFARAGVSAAWCRETSASLQSRPRMPAELASHDVVTLLRDIDLDLQQGRSPVPRMDRLRAIGPSACLELLRSFTRADEGAQKKRVVHQLLIDLRGQDLGPDAAPWLKWCEDVFQ